MSISYWLKAVEGDVNFPSTILARGNPLFNTKQDDSHLISTQRPLPSLSQTILNYPSDTPPSHSETEMSKTLSWSTKTLLKSSTISETLESQTGSYKPRYKIDTRYYVGFVPKYTTIHRLKEGGGGEVGEELVRIDWFGQRISLFGRTKKLSEVRRGHLKAAGLWVELGSRRSVEFMLYWWNSFFVCLLSWVIVILFGNGVTSNII